MNTNTRLLPVLILSALCACAQPMALKTPAAPAVVVLKTYIETYPASNYAAADSLVVLVHPPDAGTAVRATLRNSAGAILDQQAVVKTSAPVTLTADQGANFTVTFEYQSSK